MLDLTKQYSTLFRKKGGRQLFRFAHDVTKSGKLRELCSFAVWELLHQLHLFPKSRYIRFRQDNALALGARPLGGDFNASVQSLFESRGLSARVSSNNWKLFYTTSKSETFGCLYPDDCDLYRSDDNGASLIFLKRFPERLKAIFVSSEGTVLVSVKGAVYTSIDGGASFEKTLDLASPESFARFNNAMTETPDKRLVIGEYGNVWDENGWRRIAYIYYSSDQGLTWETSDYLIRQGTNKHVHIVKYSELLDRLVVADGDNYKKLWISGPLDTFDVKNPGFRAANRFHIQMGGYTSMVETGGRLLFGTDYQGGTNFLVETADGKKYTNRIIPDPYRRSPIDNMVLRKSKNGTEIWANLPFNTSNTKCLLMYTADNGETWEKVVEYDGATHKVWLLNSSDHIAGSVYFSVQDLKNNHRVVYEITDPS